MLEQHEEYVAAQGEITVIFWLLLLLLSAITYQFLTAHF
jgi:hypothetical protein